MFKRYSSIGHLRNFIQSIQYSMKKNNESERTITLTGNIKLHGTNAAIGYNTDTDEFWCQSRERILSVVSDNHGFAFWCEKNKDALKNALKSYMEEVWHSGNIIYVYGEWAGGSIQKGVGISGIPKSFFPFEVVVVDSHTLVEHKDSDGNIIYTPKVVLASQDTLWVEELAGLPNLHSIKKFQSYEETVTIPAQGSSLELSEFQNRLVEITNEVEAKCPVAAFFGIEGIGEGVVWSYQPNESTILKMKIKGEKHSVSKVKTVNVVDVEKIADIEKLADALVTENRLNQGIDKMIELQIPIDKQNTGQFIKWVMGDIRNEEMDTIIASGYEWKEVVGRFNALARDFWIAKCDDIAYA